MNDMTPLDVRLEVMGENLPPFLGNRDYFVRTILEAVGALRSLNAERELLNINIKRLTVDNRILTAENQILRLRIENPEPKMDER